MLALAWHADDIETDIDRLSLVLRGGLLPTLCSVMQGVSDTTDITSIEEPRFT